LLSDILSDPPFFLLQVTRVSKHTQLFSVLLGFLSHCDLGDGEDTGHSSGVFLSQARTILRTLQRVFSSSPKKRMRTMMSKVPGVVLVLVQLLPKVPLKDTNTRAEWQLTIEVAPPSASSHTLETRCAATPLAASETALVFHDRLRVCALCLCFCCVCRS
jgi:hypothetical protein